MTTTTQRVVVSWSSGKDSAWMLHRLRTDPHVRVVGLLTTVDEASGRVAVHGVPPELLRAQADAAGLPLTEVPLPSPCPNETYEARMREALGRLCTERGATHVAFGDLHLANIRSYRERLVEPTGLRGLFPLWCEPADTPALARRMLAGGLDAVVVRVDTARLPAELAGRRFDRALLDELPRHVDPCAERGELHTFATDCPAFARPVPVVVGERRRDDGAAWVELAPASAGGGA